MAGLQLPIVQTYNAEEDLAFFITATDGSTALQGRSLGTGRDGGWGEGVHGISDVGTGVLGESNSGVGVFGTSDAQAGVVGTSKQLDGVQGISQSAQHAGVSGSNTSGGMGVYGYSSLFDGVQGISDAKDHAGVSGVNRSGVQGMGVYGYSTNFDGVQGESGSKDHAGVSGTNNSGGMGVWASGTPAGYFNGDIQVTGDVKLSNQDCAEDFNISGPEEIEPGTVMVLREGDAIEVSHSAYDKRVAGVISGAGSLRPAIILGRDRRDNARMPLALLGKVYCKVDARYSPIEVGDLLTTSPTCGHAMKAADPVRAFGAVIGKALQPLTGGQGLIPILVALQ
ncbi:MAG TPA: hypothetical protein VG028_06835 [Terriglobia bacterium]|nr:hypothetical protein [Terriglobia bacterium]